MSLTSADPSSSPANAQQGHVAPARRISLGRGITVAEDEEDDGKFLDAINPLELDQLDQLISSQDTRDVPSPTAPRPQHAKERDVLGHYDSNLSNHSNQSDKYSSMPKKSPDALERPRASSADLSGQDSASQRICGAADIEKKRLDAIIKRKKAEALRKLKLRKDAQAAATL